VIAKSTPGSAAAQRAHEIIWAAAPPRKRGTRSLISRRASIPLDLRPLMLTGETSRTGDESHPRRVAPDTSHRAEFPKPRPRGTRAKNYFCCAAARPNFAPRPDTFKPLPNQLESECHLQAPRGVAHTRTHTNIHTHNFRTSFICACKARRTS
jgi:hypothetical protein